MSDVKSEPVPPVGQNSPAAASSAAAGPAAATSSTGGGTSQATAAPAAAPSAAAAPTSAAVAAPAASTAGVAGPSLTFNEKGEIQVPSASEVQATNSAAATATAAGPAPVAPSPAGTTPVAQSAPQQNASPAPAQGAVPPTPGVANRTIEQLMYGEEGPTPEEAAAAADVAGAMEEITATPATIGADAGHAGRRYRVFTGIGDRPWAASMGVMNIESAVRASAELIPHARAAAVRALASFVAATISTQDLTPEGLRIAGALGTASLSYDNQLADPLSGMVSLGEISSSWPYENALPGAMPYLSRSYVLNQGADPARFSYTVGAPQGASSSRVRDYFSSAALGLRLAGTMTQMGIIEVPIHIENLPVRFTGPRQPGNGECLGTPFLPPCVWITVEALDQPLRDNFLAGLLPADADASTWSVLDAVLFLIEQIEKNMRADSDPASETQSSARIALKASARLKDAISNYAYFDPGCTVAGTPRAVVPAGAFMMASGVTAGLRIAQRNFLRTGRLHDPLVSQAAAAPGEDAATETQTLDELGELFGDIGRLFPCGMVGGLPPLTRTLQLDPGAERLAVEEATEANRAYLADVVSLGKMLKANSESDVPGQAIMLPNRLMNTPILIQYIDEVPVATDVCDDRLPALSTGDENEDGDIPAATLDMSA